MRILRLLCITILSVITVAAVAQITVTPAMPTDNDSVTVVFNATQGNAGLAGYTGDIYAHTGVITNLSTSGSDWKYVKAGWGVNIPACKLTQIGSDLYQMKIGPGIRQYYGVPASEVIQKMAFVFRSGVQVGGVWLQGKTTSGGDIYANVYPSGLNVTITTPSTDFVIVNVGSISPINIQSSFADTTFLYLGSTLLTSATTSTINYNLTATNPGGNWLKAIAKNDTGMVADSFFFYVSQAVAVAPIPAGMKTGINYLSDTSVLLVLVAPLKQNVFVIGDFNQWLPSDAGFMKRAPDGKTFWKEIDGLVSGTPYIYQYLVDGTIRVGDPYADKISDPYDDSYITSATYPGMIPYPFGKAQGRATVLQTGQSPYVWQSGTFTPAKNTDLVVYELLVRDFDGSHTYQSVIDHLGYLKDLGFNAIELMPISEFEGNLSWGYFPNFCFAPDKYYGPAHDLKKLIDACHSMGIAVIQDIVLNHAAGSSPYASLYWDNVNNRPAANSPYFNPIAKHDFNVGCDMNHSTLETRKYVTDIIKYWLTEYRMDGFRFDLSKGFTQNNTLGNSAAFANYDAQRIGILKAYYDTLKIARPNAILILEHFADNIEEKELSAYGMLLWGNINGAYRYANIGVTTGTNSDLSWGSYKARGWTNPHLVSYMESHDEERQMFYSINQGSVSGSYNIRDTITALQRMKLSAAFFFTIPGPKMVYEFGERGFDYSINWPCLTSTCRMDPKPPRWDYLDDWQRKSLAFVYSSLINLRTSEAVFETTNFDLDVSSTLKKIRLKDASQSVVVLGNFGVTAGNIIPNFYNTGTWYNYFGGDSLAVTSVNQLVHLEAGEYRIYSSHKLASPIGIQENERPDEAILVYPNPLNALCHIVLQRSTVSHCEIEIYDAMGRKVQTIFKGLAGQGSEFLWYPERKGMYVIKVITEGGAFYKKVIVNSIFY
ncbi:MAG: alpha-amylase family glycosyl hydrolase [Bacteroidota bacterium]